jgi:hypothetical protein
VPVIGGVTVRSAVEDFSGRMVELTVERWGHIVECHPEVRTPEESVLEAVQAPDGQVPGRLPTRSGSICGLSGLASTLEVVVAYVEGRGQIITAFARRSMP